MNAQLTALRHALETFLAVLEEESLALASGDAERLNSLTQRRETSSRELLELWHALARQLGMPIDSGLANLRERAAGSHPPDPAWQAIEQLAREAARLNRVNQRLLEEQMRRTRIAMQVLQNAASSHALYDAGGHVADLLKLNRKIDSA